MVRKIWLENAIEEHILNNPKKDSADIVSHFKLSADITMSSLGQLVKDNKVIRQHLFGARYGYSLATPPKKLNNCNTYFERSSGYSGYRCRDCDRWFYAEEKENGDCLQSRN